MSAEEFVKYVEVKLNRIDSSGYQDVRPEEIIFFANDALKALTLAFDIGEYSRLLDEFAIKTYLAELHGIKEEESLVNNTLTLSKDVFKFKDMEAFVEIDDEKDWCDTRFLDNIENSSRQDNNFLKSFPDSPVYRLIDGKIKFEVDGFKVTKARYEYLKYPTEITEDSELNYIFNEELEDKTVTLILENLEGRRLATQPQISRS